MKAARGILIVLVVLGVLLVAADRVAAWAAQRTVADQVSAELADYQVEHAPPEVTFNDVPFLTQVVAGEYDSVTLRLRDVGNGAIRLPEVVLTATGVAAPASTILDGEGTIEADRVTGEATVGYASVTALTGVEGLELSPTPEGTLRIRLPARLLDQDLILVGTASLEVTGGAVQLRVQELTVEDGSGLPAGAEPLVADLTAQLSVDVPLPPLPYNLTLESVRAEPAGVVVAASAQDVPLTT